MRYRPAKSVPGVNRSGAGGGGRSGRYAPVASGSGWSGIANSSISIRITDPEAGSTEIADAAAGTQLLLPRTKVPSVVPVLVFVHIYQTKLSLLYKVRSLGCLPRWFLAIFWPASWGNSS